MVLVFCICKKPKTTKRGVCGGATCKVWGSLSQSVMYKNKKNKFVVKSAKRGMERVFDKEIMWARHQNKQTVVRVERKEERDGRYLFFAKIHNFIKKSINQ